MIDSTPAPADAAQALVCRRRGCLLFDHSDMVVWQQLALPGIVILVHGVNSDGEWYEQTEAGLCEGLNERTARGDHQLVQRGVEAGQMKPVQYIRELDDDGYINRNMNGKTFIAGEDSHSPAIRFRWGYKASGDELKAYGDAIFLNEHDYWGGGPFANGCSALPDLWGEGVNARLFLWLQVQHMNPAKDRPVYSCPPRAYGVLAAYRLAKLVESLRRQQADVPITIVCHSQGNMVGLAAAFLGERLPAVTDAAGRSGRCVADSYVLCNPPYSLLEDNFTEDWSQRGGVDAHGAHGRQTLNARTRTLARFFELIRGRAAQQPAAGEVDWSCANQAHGYTHKSDAQKYGVNGSTWGRVTLYCDPHDQVISAASIQGIGWRGMSDQEIAATGGAGVFTQRVFAQGFEVGRSARRGGRAHYDYWADHYRRPKPGNADFWVPASPPVRYSLAQGLEASRDPVGMVLTLLAAAPLYIILRLAKLRINALPPDEWKIPLQAPDLPQPFEPESRRFGASSRAFDEGVDPPAEQLDAQRVRDADDPYAAAAAQGRGDGASEAQLRYEQHALLRMRARREGLYANDEKVLAEDEPQQADGRYRQWRSENIQQMLGDYASSPATDHSVIMTNPMHARRALAYDVAVGSCTIAPQELRKIRIAADWRFLKWVEDGDPHKEFEEYFRRGKLGGKTLHEWANAAGSVAAMPEGIVDERTHAPDPWKSDR